MQMDLHPRGISHCCDRSLRLLRHPWLATFCKVLDWRWEINALAPTCPRCRESHNEPLGQEHRRSLLRRYQDLHRNFYVYGHRTNRLRYLFLHTNHSPTTWLDCNSSSGHVNPNFHRGGSVCFDDCSHYWQTQASFFVHHHRLLYSHHRLCDTATHGGCESWCQIFCTVPDHYRRLHCATCLFGLVIE